MIFESFYTGESAWGMMLFLESPSFDARFNLALEEYVFEKMPRDKAYLMLWQNDNTVVVGKHQNAAREVDPDFVRKQGILVVRRLSGGGAVYHDKGNLNFTVIVGAGEAHKLDFAYFAQPLIETLQGFGVKAEATGRNDITVEGAKFSGNAQYIRQGRVMHHGTILYDSDLSMVARALKPREDKFRDKAVSSVRSRVTNLRPLLGGATLAELKKAFVARVAAHNTLERYALGPEDTKAVQTLARERYGTWEWTYGKSPRYTVERHRRFKGVGEVEVYLALEEGRVTGFATRGDYFGEGDAPELTERIVGTQASPEALWEVLKDVDLGRYYHNLGLEEFIGLLIGE